MSNSNLTQVFTKQHAQSFQGGGGNITSRNEQPTLWDRVTTNYLNFAEGVRNQLGLGSDNSNVAPRSSDKVNDILFDSFKSLISTNSGVKYIMSIVGMVLEGIILFFMVTKIWLRQKKDGTKVLEDWRAKNEKTKLRFIVMGLNVLEKIPVYLLLFLAGLSTVAISTVMPTIALGLSGLNLIVLIATAISKECIKVLSLIAGALQGIYMLVSMKNFNASIPRLAVPILSLTSVICLLLGAIETHVHKICINLNKNNKFGTGAGNNDLKSVHDRSGFDENWESSQQSTSKGKKE